MAIQVQLRGGTSEEHKLFTGAPKEVTVDTDKSTIVVHDGKTVGGNPLASEKALTDFQKTINDRLLEFQQNVGKTHNHDDLYSKLNHNHDNIYGKLPTGCKGAFYKHDGNYHGLVNPDGNENSAIRTPANGILPWQSGGYSDIGANTWRFANGYFNTIDFETAKYFGETILTGRTFSAYSKEASYFILGGAMIAYGYVDFTGLSANTPKTIIVKFPKNFINSPVVLASINTSVPHMCSVGIHGISSTSFEMSLTRTNTTDTSVFWMAFGGV